MNQTRKEAPRAPHENPEKNPEEWTTGDEPMTGPQRSYLKTLCQEAGTEFDENLTKAEASKLIDELQQKTGRHPCAIIVEPPLHACLTGSASQGVPHRGNLTSALLSGPPGFIMASTRQRRPVIGSLQPLDNAFGARLLPCLRYVP